MHAKYFQHNLCIHAWKKFNFTCSRHDYTVMMSSVGSWDNSVLLLGSPLVPRLVTKPGTWHNTQGHQTNLDKTLNELAHMMTWSLASELWLSTCALFCECLKPCTHSQAEGWAGEPNCDALLLIANTLETPGQEMEKWEAADYGILNLNTSTLFIITYASCFTWF